MNRWKLLLLLRKQNGLSIRRSPAFEQSVVARIMMVIGCRLYDNLFHVYWYHDGNACCRESSPLRHLLAMMPLWLAIDFGIRFGVQQTPAMMAKPYLLQPMPFHAVIETFLVNTLIAGYNWVWLSLYVPYAVVVFFGGASLFCALLIIICGMLLMMCQQSVLPHGAHPLRTLLALVGSSHLGLWRLLAATTYR